MGRVSVISGSGMEAKREYGCSSKWSTLEQVGNKKVEGVNP